MKTFIGPLCQIVKFNVLTTGPDQPLRPVGPSTGHCSSPAFKTLTLTTWQSARPVKVRLESLDDLYSYLVYGSAELVALKFQLIWKQNLLILKF